MSNSTVTIHRRHPSPHAAPRPTSVRVRRVWRIVWRWASRHAKRVREVFARGHRGVEKAPRWRRTWRKTLATWGAAIGALLLFVLVVRAVVVVARGKPWDFPFGFNLDSRCTTTGYSCGVTSGIAMTFLSFLAATAVFLLWRLGRVRRPFVRHAREDTRKFVQSAGTIFGNVVGREELCNVIMDDLKDRDDRRPHIIVGGVGVGKTAVLVELTKVLAEHGAVPVPVRLRDAGDDLDFAELAHKRFINEVKESAHSDAEAERTWRELIKDDQIVVVADGLEEALSPTANKVEDESGPDGKDDSERDNRIRVAIETARRNRLPLVVASRPHDALVGLDAAEIELEPLGEEYALEYIEENPAKHDEQRLDWIVQTAEVTETPLYLQLAHELESKRLLGRVASEHDGHLDTRGGDRVGLRVGLLETYVQALIDGHFYPELPLSSKLREATIKQLGALACAGLRRDTIEVRFADVLPDDNSSESPKPAARQPTQAQPGDGGQYQLQCILQDSIADLQTAGEVSVRSGKDPDLKRELRLAAARGVRLGLVEAREKGVRFPHSIMQAYLASRVLGCVVQTPKQKGDFLEKALEKPGRELLSALVMYTRRPAGPKSKTAQRSNAPDDQWDDPGEIRQRLADRAADMQNDAKVLDVLVAVLELDSVARTSEHASYAQRLRERWPQRNEDHTVEEAKLGAIARFGAVARKIDQRARKQGESHVPPPAWAELYSIACCDWWYPVRLAAAQELGAGGDEAFTQLEKHLAPPDSPADLAGVPADPDRGHRKYVLRAWLAAMLLTSVSEHRVSDAKVNLRAWLDYLHPESTRDKPAPISLQIALAQGFKYAANRRARGLSSEEARVRGYLAERAAKLLSTELYWFSRLTLVQALSLWALPDADAGEQPAWRRHPGADRSGERQPEQRASDPSALIDHWLYSGDVKEEHPFVAEARELAVLALEKTQPERYLWIDESGVVTKIGSQRPRSSVAPAHSLWIPPSTGWSTLHSRAQRLVADVLILLNLAEDSHEDPADREEGLKRSDRNDLPSCLKGERGYLEADRTVGTVEKLAPGARCKDGCHFDLCPYPAKGPSQLHRAELSEAFCRRQQVLLGRWYYLWPWRRTARWQGAVPKELKQFWMAMERRARR